MVRWMRWHCPPDTGLEIRALAVWGRARYLSVTEAPHNTVFHTWMGKKHFVSFKPPRPGTEPRTLAWKAAVLTTTLGPPPSLLSNSSKLVTPFIPRFALMSIFSIAKPLMCIYLALLLSLLYQLRACTFTYIDRCPIRSTHLFYTHIQCYTYIGIFENVVL